MIIQKKIIRKHRLWELFLVRQLQFKWDEVHEIAEQLEHIQSDELINRLDEILGFPKNDPHGDPIPDRNGVFGKSKSIPLSELKLKSAGIVSGVKENSNTFLQYLDKNGIAINDKIIVHAVEPFDKSHCISVNQGKEFFISEHVAKNIFVKNVE